MNIKIHFTQRAQRECTKAAQKDLHTLRPSEIFLCALCVNP